MSFLNYDSRDIRIDIKKHFFKPDRYPIMDQETNEQVGAYQSPYTLYKGKLWVSGYPPFLFTETEPNKIAWFKIGSRPPYDFLMKNEDSVVRYRFTEVKRKMFSFGISPLEGEGMVEWTGNIDSMVLLAGLFLFHTYVYAINAF